MREKIDPLRIRIRCDPANARVIKSRTTLTRGASSPNISATASRIIPATSSARKTSSPLGTNTLVSKWSNTSLNRSANPRDVVLSSGKGSLGTPNNRRDSA